MDKGIIARHNEVMRPTLGRCVARGEALLNEFAEIVKASRRQKMKGSHMKRKLAQTADHWCHRCCNCLDLQLTNF